MALRADIGYFLIIIPTYRYDADQPQNQLCREGPPDTFHDPERDGNPLQGGQRQAEALLGEALHRQVVVFQHLFQRVGHGGNVVARQAGDAEFPVVLDHVQVQGVSRRGLAEEAHVRDLIGVTGFVVALTGSEGVVKRDSKSNDNCSPPRSDNFTMESVLLSFAGSSNNVTMESIVLPLYFDNIESIIFCLFLL